MGLNPNDYKLWFMNTLVTKFRVGIVHHVLYLNAVCECIQKNRLASVNLYILLCITSLWLW